MKLRIIQKKVKRTGIHGHIYEGFDCIVQKKKYFIWWDLVECYDVSEAMARIECLEDKSKVNQTK